MNIADNIHQIKKNLPQEVCLVAVSKTKPIEMIEAAYAAAHRDFGENKVQELASKFETLPNDIRWHFIGHLQSNKVKYIAPFVHLLHGIDSLKLLKTVHKEGLKNNRIISCLLQVKIAEEDSKFGFDKAAILSLFSDGTINELANVNVVGLMGMATNTSDNEKVKQEFSALKAFFDEIKAFPSTKPHFETLSMGMSGDYPLAIECGSNMVRVGSAIFGQRAY